jgi:hypothetical protein
LRFRLELNGLPDPPFTVMNGDETVNENDQFVVKANGSKSLSVVFAPTSPAATFSGVIGINSSDPNDSYSPVNVSATSVPGKLDISTKSLNLHNVRVGQVKTKSLKLTNGGKGILSGAVGSLGAPFTVTSGAGAYTLKPGKSRSVKVQFQPTAPGTFPATLTITSDDPSALTVPVNVTGVGISIGTGN